MRSTLPAYPRPLKSARKFPLWNRLPHCILDHNDGSYLRRATDEIPTDPPHSDDALLRAPRPSCPLCAADHGWPYHSATRGD
jgi:hypothetical protein